MDRDVRAWLRVSAWCIVQFYSFSFCLLPFCFSTQNNSLLSCIFLSVLSSCTPSHTSFLHSFVSFIEWWTKRNAFFLFSQYLRFSYVLSTHAFYTLFYFRYILPIIIWFPSKCFYLIIFSFLLSDFSIHVLKTKEWKIIIILNWKRWNRMK